jgi:hypothetical protein
VTTELSENFEEIIDRVHRDIGYLTMFGRKAIREHLHGMKEEEFQIKDYHDKNKPISTAMETVGWHLLLHNSSALMEEYWKQINEEILAFNTLNKRSINRGIPLANMGVAQLVQGKVIQGLYNIYSAYEDDRVCLQHLPEVTIDPVWLAPLSRPKSDKNKVE